MDAKHRNALISVALQDIGDCISLLGRLRIADDRLNGLEWGRVGVLLIDAMRRIYQASPDSVSAPEGSKINPGIEDCYTKALPDEPFFTLLARDPSAPDLVMFWAEIRAQQIKKGQRPKDDETKVKNAQLLANNMKKWRETNKDRWNKVVTEQK